MLVGTKFVRYCQTLSRMTMFNFKHLQNLTKDELTGDVIKISRRIKVSPVMIVRQILKLEGLTKREVKDTIEGNLPPPDYLKDSLEKALRHDPVFSPKGIKYSKKRGRLGEDLIAEWVDYFSLEYTRDLGQGGPDLMLKTPLKVDIRGKIKEIDWIESKASYGDKFEIKRNRAQFKRYDELGRGIVFYWYGVTQNIKWPVFTWKDLHKRVEPSLKARIKRFITFVPPEFKFLIA